MEHDGEEMQAGQTSVDLVQASVNLLMPLQQHDKVTQGGRLAQGMDVPRVSRNKCKCDRRDGRARRYRFTNIYMCDRTVVSDGLHVR